MILYVIQQGDSMSKLAYLRGFDAKTVWQAPMNAELAAKRKSMDVLCPGDIVHLPDSAAPSQDIHPHTTNSFVARVPMVPLTYRLTRAGKGIANARYEVLGTPRRIEGTTDDSGTLKVEVPIITREIQIRLIDRGICYHVKIGDLDPHDEPSGVRMRLANLGYLSPDPAKQTEVTVYRAIICFQLDEGLPPTGELDTATLEALRVAHGH